MAIQSVLNQDFQYYELIIIDDGSNDDTENTIALFNDKRIRYSYIKNGGVCKARNTGASFARGKWLLFLDSDDTVEKQWLSDFKSVIDRRNHLLDLVFCQVNLIVGTEPNRLVKLIDPRKPYLNSKQAGLFLTGAFAIHKNLFFRAGLYDENLRYSENTELSFRVMSYTPQFDFVDSPNLIYQQSSTGGSKNFLNKYESTVYILSKHRKKFEKERHVKQLYLQVAGVSAIKTGRYAEGKKLITQALLTRPFVIKVWMQWFASQFEFTARFIWRQ